MKNQTDLHADIPIDFPMRLVGAAKHKVILTLDNLKIHHAKSGVAGGHNQIIEVVICPRLLRFFS